MAAGIVTGSLESDAALLYGKEKTLESEKMKQQESDFLKEEYKNHGKICSSEEPVAHANSIGQWTITEEQLAKLSKAKQNELSEWE